MGRTISTSERNIAEQAMRIRDIAQEIMDAYNTGRAVEPYARNKTASGHLAGDAACLGIMIVAYEERRREWEKGAVEERRMRLREGSPEVVYRVDAEGNVL